MDYRKPPSALLLATLLFAVSLGGCHSKQDRARQAYEQYQVAQTSDDLPATRRTLLALVAADDSVADYWIQLGKVHLQLAEYGAAYDAFVRAHELDRANASVLEVLTQLQLRSGDLQEAVKTARELDLVSPGNPAVSLTYGYVALRRGKFEEADKQVDQVLATSPYDPSAKILRARILFGTEKPQEAISLLREQVRVQPSDQASLRALTAMYELFEQWTDAAWATRSLLVWQPNDQDIRARLIDSELRAGRTDLARADTVGSLSQASAHHIDALLVPWISSGAQSHIADLVFERGRAATGERRLAFARFLAVSGRWQDVIKLTGDTATLPVGASNVAANSLYGAALASSGQKAEGLSRLDSVIAFDSANSDALHGRAQVRRMAGTYNLAIEDAQKLVAVDRTSSASWILLADIQRSAGSTDAARRTLWDAFHENSADRSIFDALAALVIKIDGPLAGQRLAAEFRDQRREELERSFA